VAELEDIKRAVSDSPLMRRAPVLKRDILAALDERQRLLTAADAVLELYEEDPEYALEWPALHHLGHVRAGGHNPECRFCAEEMDSRG